MKKPLIITIITVIILALIGGGTLWYLKTQKQEPVNNNEPVVNNEGEENGDVGEEIDTSDWLTYRNEEYGFEFKYPEYYTLKQRPSYGDALNMEFVHENVNNHISLIVSPLTQYIKDSIEYDQQREECQGDKNNYSCYIYRSEDNKFYQTKNFINYNKKFEFGIELNSINQNLSPTENINLFLQNKFSPQDQNIINILDQMKASMIFF